MEYCYKFLGCDKADCVMYGRKDGTNCWETKGTLCCDPEQEILTEHKLDKCMYCEYYRKALKLEK